MGQHDKDYEEVCHSIGIRIAVRCAGWISDG